MLIDELDYLYDITLVKVLFLPPFILLLSTVIIPPHIKEYDHATINDRLSNRTYCRPTR